MRIIQVSNKEELLREIDSLDNSVEDIYINTRPSVEIINRILENAPAIRKIYCPPSLLKQTSTRAFEVLDKHGVSLDKHGIRVGRPTKYSSSIVQEVFERKERGMSVKDISKQMKIPIRTVYYYLKKNNP
ncbi:MAG: helix-turn-helix domain-containing protein [Candidatus Diapherotrites archaeon]|nr:helix-turn-helix domain-containing protein [Candidatus Diapherotrites archaeon]